MVKVLDPATEEGSISERLQDNLASPNHGLPSEVISSEPRLLVTPFIGDLDCIEYSNRTASFFLDLFHQIIEVRRSLLLVFNAPSTDALRMSTGRRVSPPLTYRTSCK